MKAIIRKVQRCGYSRSAISGLNFEIGRVKLRGQSVIVFRGNGQEGWLTAAQDQFPSFKPEASK